MKIQSYIKEIQYRIFFWFLCFIINNLLLFFYKEEIFFLLGQQQPKNFPYFIATNLNEVFIVMFKCIFFLSLYISIPIIILQIWLFIIPALYNYEYKILKRLVILIIVIFVFTTYITYCYIIPLCWTFFLSFEMGNEKNAISICIETRLNEYLTFFVKLFCTLNAAAIICLSFFFLLKTLTLNTLIKIRKIIYFFAFLLATIVTPPDLTSQLVLGFFLILLYEIMLFFFFLVKEYN